MQVSVRYFAAFREAAGVEVETLETSAASTAELFSECRSRHPALRSWSASMVAVNDELASWEAPISEGDEILFFPPVAGG
jgi:molybdopterin converting factor subunit 1